MTGRLLLAVGVVFTTALAMVLGPPRPPKASRLWKTSLRNRVRLIREAPAAPKAPSCLKGAPVQLLRTVVKLTIRTSSVVLLSVFLLIGTSTSAAPGTTERDSVDSAGVEGNDSSVWPATSQDGRFVAFHSYASDLVVADTNLVPDVFVRDRQAGTTTRMSVDTAGNEALGPGGGSYDAAISANGRFVAFDSSAVNLVPGDTNSSGDVFVRDRDTDNDGIFDEPASVATTRVSVDSLGLQANGSSSSPAISSTGRFVAFESSASNLVPGDTNGAIDIFLRDRDSDGNGVFDEIGGTTTTRVSVSSTGDQSNGGSRWAAVSTDGRVAFGSGANNLVPGDTNGVTDVFTHDFNTGQTTRVSVDSQGQQGNDFSGAVGVSPPGISISADGRFVAFASRASNLVPGDTNICGPPLRATGPCEDIFVHDSQSGVTERVSVDSSGNQGNNESSAPAISSDGRYVAFESMASNLVARDTQICDFNGFMIPCLDIFLHDRQSGGTIRISEGMGGAEANDTSLRPAIAAGGRVVAFFSEASNLVPNDGNSRYDVFSVQLNDTDGDGLLDPFDPDDDNDGFSDVIEVSAGTNPLVRCGVDAWPPDINNDGHVDIIGDVSRVTGEFGKSVPPAPARYDIAPDPPDHYIDVISDIVRLTGLFGQSCS